MPKTITQKVVFKNTTAKRLYDLYMDAKQHTESTGSVTKIRDKEGTVFTAGDGYMWGKNLRLVKNELIVQTWIAADWDKNHGESIFIIRLEPRGNDAILYMTHANIPDEHAKNLSDGWHDYYWKPWKTYLQSQ